MGERLREEKEETTRLLLKSLFDIHFGKLSPEIEAKIDSAHLELLNVWFLATIHTQSPKIEEILLLREQSEQEITSSKSNSDSE